jgi:hypothetical protein
MLPPIRQRICGCLSTKLGTERRRQRLTQLRLEALNEVGEGHGPRVISEHQTPIAYHTRGRDEAESYDKESSRSRAQSSVQRTTNNIRPLICAEMRVIEEAG